MNLDRGAQEDAALLLAIKDAEINMLRQQLAQLSEDLRRNLALLSTKDEETSKLRTTVDALRALLAEKDNLFSQFQAQVQELELMRVRESEQRMVLEQLLARKEAEWQQQLETAQQGRQAEVAVMEQQLKGAEEKYSSQLLQARQAAMDESFQRSTQQQAAMERTAENVHQLQQQVDSLTSALGAKDAELQAAHRQLAAALDAGQQLEATHAKAVDAKDKLIAHLKQQLEQQTCNMEQGTAEHDANMTKLIKSLSQMQESCQQQAQEVHEYATAQKRLQEERKVLREELKQQETIITKLQTEKGVLESALQHEVTAQATAQAQVNIFQAKLNEAVVELEARCSAAEARTSKLMGQLVDERGRLVDAVIEQANSSTPQLAAELAKTLEADRLRTQAELQMAQERSKSLAEDLALIRSTLVPLLTSPATAAAAAAGVVAPQQPINASMAALAQLLEQKGWQQQQQQPQHTMPAGWPCVVTKEYSCNSVYASPKAAGAVRAETWASPRSPAVQQFDYQSPARAAAPSLSMGLEQGLCYQAPAPSPAVAAVPNAAGLASPHKSPAQAMAAAALTATPGSCRGGGLAGLVSELQADVDKLQQQLHQSRRQLNWECADPGMAQDRPNSPSTEPHQLDSPMAGQKRQQEQQQDLMAHAGSVSRCSSPMGVAATPEKQLQDALKHLLLRTEQLSAENGALKLQIMQNGSPVSSQAGSHSSHSPYRPDHQQQQKEQLLHTKVPSNYHSPGGRGNRSRFQGAYNQNPGNGLLVSSSRHDRIGAGLVRDGSVADSEQYQQYGDSSSTYSDGAHVADDLSVAASEELAAAEATAAVECARRRRQARAAAALQQHHRSPGRAAMELVEQELKHRQRQQQRPSSIQRADSIGDSSVVSTECTDTLGAVGARLQAQGTAGKHSYDSKQLLETVLANLPANNKTGKLLRDLTGAAAASGNATAKTRSSHGNRDSRGSKAGGLLQEQLQRLAEMSPGRQQLLRALAGSS